MQAFNHEVATRLREIADLLKSQQANPFRINAYRHAADTLDSLGQNVADLMLSEGIEGLVALPGIGEGIARSIYEYIATGRMSRLENLKGVSDPVELFRSIPTVGRALAERIHDELHVDSLEALENAARQGQLARVEGLGRKRREAIEAWLQKHLDDQRRPVRAAPVQDGPAVKLILRVDDEYRQKAAAGKLPMITPKRFNPENRAWLPILHTTRDHWHFTALYSNTARAHQLGTIIIARGSTPWSPKPTAACRAGAWCADARPNACSITIRQTAPGKRSAAAPVQLPGQATAG
jgi:putative hydrolase